MLEVFSVFTFIEESSQRSLSSAPFLLRFTLFRRLSLSVLVQVGESFLSSLSLRFVGEEDGRLILLEFIEGYQVEDGAGVGEFIASEGDELLDDTGFAVG